MALITTIGRNLITLSLVEDNDHIYIAGQAYTKSSLTPVFGKTRFHTTSYDPGSNARPARWCTIPDGTSNLTCYQDSTLSDPGGLIANHGTLTVNGDVFSFPNISNGVFAAANQAVYGKLDSAGVFQGGYVVAAPWKNIVPIGYNATLNQIYVINGNGNTASSGVLTTYPLTPAAGTAVISHAYGYSCSLLSENATYYFVGSIIGTASAACNLKIDAVNKNTAAVSAVLASTAQSTTYPRLTVSNPYSESTDSKWAYTVGANGSDPFYTVRYNNYNQSTLGNTGGNCTIDWGGTSATAEFAQPQKSAAQSSIRTWVVTGTSNSFVYFALCDDGSSTTQTVANMKMHGFQISSGTPSSLTFKETIAIGTAHGRIRNIFPITNNWQTIAVMTDSDATLYTWDDTNGYTVGVSIPYSIKSANMGTAGAFGVDTQGRIWVHSSGGAGSTLSVYSPTVATTITLTFAASSYNYSGTTINSSFNLSAYNSSGARIVTDVQVVFDSPNCTFSDDTTTKTITTSSGGETSTNIKIIAPGQIRAVANIAV